EREQLALEPLARAPQRERHEDAQLAERLVELRRVDGQRARGAELDDVVRELALVGERLGREARRPGEVRVARGTPAAARRETTQATDGVTDGDGRNDRVGIREERHAMLAHVQKGTSTAAEKPP